MIFIIGILCFFIFLYSIYILGKDDYLLIRKNISLEQLFDVVFLTFFSSLIFVILYLFVIEKLEKVSRFGQIFLSTSEGLSYSLTWFLVGFFIAFFLISRHSKYPIAHLFDFFTFSVLSFLPFWYLSAGFFAKKSELLFFMGTGIFYLAVLILFMQLLLPASNKNIIKDGSLGSVFLIIFSSITLLVSFIYKYTNEVVGFSLEDIALLIIFLTGILFLISNEGRRILPAKK